MDASLKPNTVLNSGVHWWFGGKWARLHSQGVNSTQNIVT